MLGQIGENDLLHAARGTNVVTNTAAFAFIIINSRQIIHDADRTLWTSLFTLSAGDAGVLADLAGVRALVLVAAGNDGLGLLGHHRDDMLGADRLAKTTANATAGVHVRDAVLHANRIRRACGGAIAKSNATKAASVGTAVQHSGRFTSRNTVVDRFLGGCLAVTVAMYVSDNVSRCFYLNAKHLAQLFSGKFRTGNAEIGLRRSLCHGNGVVVTALIAAGTAVNTGQAGTDGLDLFVRRNAEEVRNEGKQNACNQRNRTNDKERN